MTPRDRLEAHTSACETCDRALNVDNLTAYGALCPKGRRLFRAFAPPDYWRAMDLLERVLCPVSLVPAVSQ